MDVIAVYKSAQIAVERARSGQGPTLLEFMTYRFRGHSEADSTPGFGYRPREEVAYWQEKCPLKNARALFVKNGWVEEDTLREVEQECQNLVLEALAYAETSPAVQAEWALDDVFTPSKEGKK
jgi:pyruvate dehydrogenase E1 component alpha subunit